MRRLLCRRPVPARVTFAAKRLPAALIAAFLCCGSATAGTFKVRVHPVNGEGDVAGSLVVESCNDDACSAPTKRLVSALDHLEATVSDVTPIARVTPRVANHWGPAVIVRSGDDVLIPLWPARTVSGRLQAARGEELPQTVTLTIRTAPGAQPDVHDTQEQCNVVKGRWSCPVPESSLDLRVAAGDFVPAYFWNVDATQAVDVGIVKLTRGASVFGRVDATDSQLKGVTVALKLASESASRRPFTQFDATPTARGFFQFRGLPRGTYRIEATRPGASTATVSGFAVTADREYALDKPLLIMPLAALEVLIAPPVQPGTDRPWSVVLDRLQPDFSTTLVASSAASLKGEWKNSNVAAGDYLLGIKDSAGSLLSRRRLHVEPLMKPFFIDLDLIPVRGRVRSGGDAVRATVSLRWRDVDQTSTVRFHTNADGEFEGVVPHEGKWQVLVELENGGNQIRRPDATVKRSDLGPSRIDVDLPDARVHGVVLDVDRKPTVAFVAVTRDQKPVAEVKTEADGSFDFSALDGGPVSVEARSPEGESGSVTVTAAHDAPAVEIVLYKKRKIVGRVETRSGSPIAGAIIHYAGDAFTDVRRTFSDPEGNFRFEIPEPTTTLTWAALAPGFGTVVNTIPAPRTQQFTIVLDEQPGVLALQMGSTPPWPYIRSQSSSFLAVAFIAYPPEMRSSSEFGPEGRYFRMTPGIYTICPAPIENDHCVTRTVERGKIVTADTRPAKGLSP